MFSTIIVCATTLFCAADPAIPSQPATRVPICRCKPRPPNRPMPQRANPQQPATAAAAEKKSNPQVRVAYRPQTEPQDGAENGAKNGPETRTAGN